MEEKPPDQHSQLCRRSFDYGIIAALVRRASSTKLRLTLVLVEVRKPRRQVYFCGLLYHIRTRGWLINCGTASDSITYREMSQ